MSRQLKNACFLLMFLIVGRCTDSVFVSVEYEEPHSELCPRDENTRVQTVDLPSNPFVLLLVRVEEGTSSPESQLVAVQVDSNMNTGFWFIYSR